MRNYELTIVLSGKTTAAKKKDAIETIGKIVAASGGKVLKTDDWGKRELAYKIEKNDEGVFVFFEIEMPTEAIKNIKDKLKLENDILRYLIIVKK